MEAPLRPRARALTSRFIKVVTRSGGNSMKHTSRSRRLRRRRRRRRRPAAARLIAAPAQAQTVDEHQEEGRDRRSACWSTSRPTASPTRRTSPTATTPTWRGCWPRTWGVKLEIVPVTGPNRIPFLLTNKVDLLVASLGDHARARQAGPVLRSPTPAATIVLLAPKKAAIKGRCRPQGHARRRGAREHAGHRR